MTDYKEEQSEELEVLRSIYEGDEQFNEINETCFQYKYGSEDGKSILVEVSWPDTYPSILPSVNLGTCCFVFIKINF
jgi:RWD domain.